MSSDSNSTQQSSPYRHQHICQRPCWAPKASSDAWRSVPRPSTNSPLAPPLCPFHKN
jgi:hypothetical protein